MHPFFEDYLNRLEELHHEIDQALDGLPPEALDWVQGPEMNSIAVLVVHLIGAERYWIGDVAAGEPSGRVREQEFVVRGLDAVALQQRLAQAGSYARHVCDSLRFEDLPEKRVSPGSHREHSIAWCLLHALEHTALHLGHIQIARQLWDQK